MQAIVHFSDFFLTLVLFKACSPPQDPLRKGPRV